jgi:hypothetical protein
MRFQADFVRGDRRFPVSGHVHRLGDGSRHGTFVFSTSHAIGIRDGPARLVTDARETWDVVVFSCHSGVLSDRGTCAFEVAG